MSGLEVSGVSVSYDGRPAVSGVGLHVPGGGWLGVIGPNGAGKTTLLKAIAGLVPASGTVAFGGHPLHRMRRRDVTRLVAYVPQRPMIPTAMTVADYVVLGRTPYVPYLGTESRTDLEIVEGVLDRLELSDFAERPLSSLSGGEAQRAILARALAQEAPLLLLDEPTAALDIGHQHQVLELIDGLRHAHGLTVVSAMHDLTLAGQFCDDLVLLCDGRIVAHGPPSDVLTEVTIRMHYGVAVRVLHDGDGIVVVPTRTASPVRGLASSG